MKLELDWNVVQMVALFLLFTTSTTTTCVHGRDHDSNPEKTRNRPPSSPAPRTTTSPSAFVEITSAPVFKTPNPKRAPRTARPRGSTLPPTPLPFLPPSQQPTPLPTSSPTKQPTQPPSSFPTKQPTQPPSSFPTKQPTQLPTLFPTKQPTQPPTLSPTGLPTSPPTATPKKCFASSCSNQLMIIVSRSLVIYQTVDARCLRNSPAIAVGVCSLGSVQANFFLISFLNNCTASVETSPADSRLYVLEAPDSVHQCPGTGCAMLSLSIQQGSNPLSFPATAGAKYSLIVVPRDVATATSYLLGIACGP